MKKKNELNQNIEKENLVRKYYKMIEFIIKRTEEIVDDIFLDENLTLSQKHERLDYLEDLKEIMIQDTMERIKMEIKNKEIDNKVV